MALIMFDSFDDGTASDGRGKWTMSGPVTTATARTGTLTPLHTASTHQYHTTSLTHATFVVGVAVLFETSPIAAGGGISLWGDTGATQHITVTFGPSGEIYVRRGNAGGTILLQSDPGLISTNIWYYIELKATLSDTVGTAEVKVNGASVIAGTGLDTKNAGTATVFDTVRLTGCNNNSDTRYDDFYLLNGDGTSPNDYLGDSKVELLLPTSDGTTTDWSLSTGTTHWELVDETPPNTTDYVFSNVDGEIDLVNIADLSTATATVHGVQWGIYAAKSDAGARSVRRVLRTGAANYTGSDRALGTGYINYRELFVTDPATAAAWTASNVNALQVGVEVRP